MYENFVSFYGYIIAYENSTEEDKSLYIARGHNKDHRPDLKQIIFGLSTTKDRVIVIGDVANGNTSDKNWNKDILKELRQSMTKYGLSDFIYIADSAAVTEETLKRLAGGNDDDDDKSAIGPAITFVSRLPGNFKLEAELKSKAISNPKAWKDAGTFSDKKDAAVYKVQSFEDKLYDKPYRFIVCHSSQLAKKKERTIEARIKDEEKALLKAIDDFHKIDFYCEADADAALEKFDKDLALKYHELMYKVETVERPVKRLKRGRPRRDERPQFETIYKTNIRFCKDDLRIKGYKDMESMFVLITNSMDAQKMDDKAIIKEYKEQSSVETTFRVLKNPYFIDELYIKTPQRLEALSYVILIALMVLTLLERNVREALKGEAERAAVSGKRKTFTPTGVSIVEALEQVKVLSFYDEDEGSWQRHCILTDTQKRLLRLAGFNETIYTEAFKKDM